MASPAELLKRRPAVLDGAGHNGVSVGPSNGHAVHDYDDSDGGALLGQSEWELKEAYERVRDGDEAFAATLTEDVLRAISIPTGRPDRSAALVHDNSGDLQSDTEVTNGRIRAGDASSGGRDSVGADAPKDPASGVSGDVVRGIAAGVFLAAATPTLELSGLVGLRKPLRYTFWLGADIGKRIRYGPDVREFGINAWVGLFGRGKTISMVERAYRRKLLLRDKIQIFSNVPCAFADGAIRGVNHLKDMWFSEKNTIFLFDEIHLTWNQHGWKDQDPELIESLTQQRKAGPGFAIYYTTQHSSTAEIIWRRLAEHIIECSGWPTNRWIWQKAFAGIAEFNEGQPRFNPMSGKDMRNIAWEYNFIADDGLRAMYDTKWVAGKMAASGQSSRIGIAAVQRKIAQAAQDELARMALREQADRATWGARLQSRVARMGR